MSAIEDLQNLTKSRRSKVSSDPRLSGNDTIAFSNQVADETKIHTRFCTYRVALKIIGIVDLK